jgi:ribosomal protein S3AE
MCGWVRVTTLTFIGGKRVITTKHSLLTIYIITISILFTGYTLRLFCIAFTAKMPGQMKKTCYAQSGQVRQIRKKMVDIMTEEASSEDLKGLIQKL